MIFVLFLFNDTDHARRFGLHADTRKVLSLSFWQNSSENTEVYHPIMINIVAITTFLPVLSTKFKLVKSDLLRRTIRR